MMTRTLFNSVLSILVLAALPPLAANDEAMSLLTRGGGTIVPGGLAPGLIDLVGETAFPIVKDSSGSALIAGRPATGILGEGPSSRAFVVGDGKTTMAVADIEVQGWFAERRSDANGIVDDEDK